MGYLTREMALSAIRNMKGFHGDAHALFDQYDIDFLDNLGRRNIIMSQVQEKFFAKELGRHYSGVYEDGRTGQPDIVIDSLTKELECKLTSRHKSGAISLQTDFSTLSQKEDLDYLYLVADERFEEFAVLHFENLTIADFHPPANGSRGKSVMNKARAMAKCNVLVGDVECLNDYHLSNLHEKLPRASTPRAIEKIKSKMEYWSSVSSKYRFQLEEV